jgi:hypothetical protein
MNKEVYCVGHLVERRVEIVYPGFWTKNEAFDKCQTLSNKLNDAAYVWEIVFGSQGEIISRGDMIIECQPDLGGSE